MTTKKRYVEVHAWDAEHDGDLEMVRDAIHKAGGKVENEDFNYEAETCDFYVSLNKRVREKTFFNKLKEQEVCAS